MFVSLFNFLPEAAFQPYSFQEAVTGVQALVVSRFGDTCTPVRETRHFTVLLGSKD